MNGILTVLMLIVANIFMTFAWYGHLKLQTMNVITDHTPLILVIALSWLLALPEYSLQVPANRIGFAGNGGPFTLMQLKVIQEAISITIFTVFTMFIFQGQHIQWNHIVAFGLLILAVFFVFLK